jgi:imidazolonepropionase
MKEKADLIVTAGQMLTCRPGGMLKRGREMKDVGLLAPGAMAVKGSRIVDTGTQADIEEAFECPEEGRIDAPNGVIMPGLVDAHTHPVFAGSRIDEYLLRARGATYIQIHNRGGGILSTVKATRAASTEDLMARLKNNLTRMLLHGTTTAEAKSGYGLATEEEIRQLILLRDVQREHPMELVSTFLGAHTLPEEHKMTRDTYIDEIIGTMLPRVAREKLARYVDVFCEEGAFTMDESRRILQAAKKLGMGLRIHAEQFSSQGAARMAAEMGAASCDHLLKLRKSDIDELKKFSTVAVFMPGTEFFLALSEFGPLRESIDSGVPVALGTDYNAGSCLSESMPMAMSTAVLHMKMEPEEAINAATVNAAHSVGKGNLIGSLNQDMQADFIVLDIPDYREWLYHFGVNLVERVVKKGKTVFRRGNICMAER